MQHNVVLPLVTIVLNYFHVCVCLYKLEGTMLPRLSISPQVPTSDENSDKVCTLDSPF